MSGSPLDFAINEARYEWCVRAFSFVRRRLGVNIKVHGDEGVIDSGQIFLFNHFARFETIIPQYVIHQATGAFCRCVAAAELFAGNEGFARFLRSVGAVPNDRPGLLAFLAAEILRGRKVIFFPEGGMIKDRRVVNDAGEYSILSPMARTERKHHRGPAATALTLEIFKQRILAVHEAGDRERLDRWVAAIGLDSVDALLAAARRPTMLVPANITFFPIHTSDNILRKGAELMAKELGEEAREELLIEGNLLLRRTDMDIRFGRPIRPHLAWTLQERLFLKSMFEEIDGLDELVAMKDTAPRRLERMIAAAVRRETQRLRDLCMREMYEHLTVNLNHIAARLIFSMMAAGTTEIARDRFHRLLYAAVKAVQNAAGVHLHRSLRNPEAYEGLHEGASPLLSELVATAREAGLVEETPELYRFLPKLRQPYARHEARLGNIVAVYANEIAPVAAACAAIDEVLRNEARLALPHLLFDDELRAFAWCKQHYGRARHAAINELETATESGQPYLFLPARRRSLGVVLVHGFLASPAELRGLGERLSALGYPVLGVRLKGHGISPWDLRDRSWRDWLASVRRGYAIMAELAERVCIIGFSTGGSLALLLAADAPPRLAGVCAVAAPLRFRNRNLVFVPLIHGLNRLTEWASPWEGLMPFRINESEHPHINYRHIPMRGLFELRRVTEELEGRLPEVACPVQLLQGRDDRVVDPASAERILERLGTTAKTLHMIETERHGIAYEDIGGTQNLMIDFVERLTPPEERETARPRAPRTSMTLAGQRSAEAVRRLTEAVTHSVQRLMRSRRPAPAVARAYPWESSYPAGIDWRASIEPKPLTAILDAAVETYGQKTCLTFRGKHFRYAEVGRLVDRAAKGFQALGVGKGIKVGLMLPNCPYAVICFYGVLKAGGTVVNINPLYSEREIDRMVADSGLCLLVTLDMKALYDKVAAQVRTGRRVERLVVCRLSGVMRFTEKVLFDLFKGRDSAPIPADDRHVTFESLIDNDGAFTPVPVDPKSDIAVLQYTGGTTGTPKGARLTHANLFVNTAQLALWAPEARRGEEVCLGVLPLFHAFGMTAVMNLSLWLGAEIVLLPRFQPAEVLEAIDRAKATLFIGVPTMYSGLIGVRDIGKYDLATLRFCISGGAPLPLALQRRFEDIVGCPLVEGYGLSEASPVCTVNPLSGGGKPGSVGLPLPGTVVEIVGLDDPDSVLGIGERGEICISGPQVMAGYADRARENVDAFRGGRLHTGDVGYVDEDGYVYIVDRIKDLIISGGFNVYPRQVEEAIHLHPDVEEVAVCGLPDAHRGEIVKAFVKLRAGGTLTAAELRAFLADKLAPFEMPRRIVFRDTLPKTLIGKISKKDLLAEEAQAEPAPAGEAEKHEA